MIKSLDGRLLQIFIRCQNIITKICRSQREKDVILQWRDHAVISLTRSSVLASLIVQTLWASYCHMRYTTLPIKYFVSSHPTPCFVLNWLLVWIKTFFFDYWENFKMEWILYKELLSLVRVNREFSYVGKYYFQQLQIVT